MSRTSDLTKIFRTEEVETTALNKINLEVKEGEYVAVMGPSGCGKSTLLNILGLLDNPTSGSYLFNGTEVANLRERDRTIFRKGNIGFVFQSFNLIDELNVYENVELPLIYLKMKSGERKQKVEEGGRNPAHPGGASVPYVPCVPYVPAVFSFPDSTAPKAPPTLASVAHLRDGP